MEEKNNKTVPLKDITSDAMNALLNFLYTETIVLTEENISDMLYAASLMQIEGKKTILFWGFAPSNVIHRINSILHSYFSFLIIDFTR